MLKGTTAAKIKRPSECQ